MRLSRAESYYSDSYIERKQKTPIETLSFQCRETPGTSARTGRYVRRCQKTHTTFLTSGGDLSREQLPNPLPSFPTPNSRQNNAQSDAFSSHEPPRTALNSAGLPVHLAHRHVRRRCRASFPDLRALRRCSPSRGALCPIAAGRARSPELPRARAGGAPGAAAGRGRGQG